MARPKINPDYHRKNIALTIDPDLLRRTRLIAASEGKSLSRMVEELLLCHLAIAEKITEHQQLNK